MDFSKLTTNNKVALGGGAFALISGLFPWFSFGSFGGFSDAFEIDTSASGYDTGMLATFGLLFVAAGVAVLTLKVMDVQDVKVQNLAAEQVAMVVTAIGAAFVVLRFLNAPGGVDRSWGIFVAIIAAGSAVAGTYLSAKDAGIAIPSADDFKSADSSEAPTTF